ncbi:MAG: TetR/AcrR family transcriptional regulator [Cyanobacteria bacterium]|nr:TetR/AcrR family transcriptional regulator [Cyanobacteriota bacterium]MDA0866973.1 TetR/AcrR family transcriptional regulator [Cyanobacteriota bacterium]
MGKGEQTKQHIVAEAAGLFNQRGYVGTSMAELMKATGLQKGGIYNHFQSKHELSLAAFDYAIAQVTRLYRQVLRQERHGLRRMVGILDIYRRLMDDPPVPGGCPMLNAAVDSDDTDPVLRSRVRAAMDNWRSLLRQVLQKGVRRGEFRADIDIEMTITVVVATLEGGIMLGKLYNDPVLLNQAITHVQGYLQTLVEPVGNDGVKT